LQTPASEKGSTPPPALSDNRSPATGNRFRRAIVRLYAALHRWGESGWAGSAVGGWGVMQGSVIPGPSDALLVPLGLADPRRALVLAAWATAGATVGGIIAYTLGSYFFSTLSDTALNWFVTDSAQWESRRAQFESKGWMLVALSTVSPFSTKMVCLAAGAFGVPFPEFSLALLGGRAARFLAVGLVLKFAGGRLRAILERWLGRPVEALR
jgi:membrane protein YqaA with SNARE-associated domain